MTPTSQDRHAAVNAFANRVAKYVTEEGDPEWSPYRCAVEAVTVAMQDAWYEVEAIGSPDEPPTVLVEPWDLADWCRRVDAWHERAFPAESMEQLGLCLAEEVGELIRTILKESHGTNDRRADTDWRAERITEFGDVMICLAKIAVRDGLDVAAVIEDRLAAVAARFPGRDAQIDAMRGDR